MMDLLEIKKLIKPKKSLGQNFLVNADISRKTAELSLNNLNGDDCGVIEIGPGLGALTGELCKIYKKVLAVEIDKSFVDYLNALEYSNLKIIFGDFLDINMQDLIAREFAGIKNINICANLPYYITTPIILKIIRGDFRVITVMVQKEAADKLYAKAGTGEYCETSVLVSYFGEAKRLFNVPKSNFYPQPNVLSSVVQIIPRRICEPENQDLLFKIIRAAFEQRRKTLANSISAGLNLDKRAVAEIIKEVTGSENIRGEELDIIKFCAVADLINIVINKKEDV